VDRRCSWGRDRSGRARRGDRIVGELREAAGDAVVFAHGHVLRVLAARGVDLECQALREVGFDFREARTIIDLDRAMVAGRIDVEGLDGLTGVEAITRLTNLSGIGRWSPRARTLVEAGAGDP
jgi:3-methyladenine DNA glycosylase/8-oxoguanine DNA glycosylase